MIVDLSIREAQVLSEAYGVMLEVVRKQQRRAHIDLGLLLAGLTVTELDEREKICKVMEKFIDLKLLPRSARKGDSTADRISPTAERHVRAISGGYSDGE